MLGSDGRAVLLLGSRGAGKTSTALAERGWTHAGDDLIVLGHDSAFVRESQVIELLDRWLAKTLRPHRIKQMLIDTWAQQNTQPFDAAAVRAQAKIKECDLKLKRHRAADSQTQGSLAEDEIEALITTLGGLVDILAKATPEDRQKVYLALRIRLTYEPGEHQIDHGVC